MPLSRRVAGSAMTLAGRRVLIIAITAVSTAIIARALGPDEFGALAFGTAIFLMATTAGDFGFSLVLARDMAARPDERGRLLRAALHLQITWCCLLAVGLLAMGLAIGLNDPRGQVLVALVPAMALSGFGPARQVFMVIYRTRELAAIDLLVNLAQVSAMALAALLGFGALGVACALSAGTAINAVAVARASYRHVPKASRPSVPQMQGLLKRAAPLGVMSLMSRVYLSIDLVILGALVADQSLGQYAAAVKLYALLVAIPGFVTAAALPGFSELATAKDEFNVLAVRVWHWLAVIGLPACVAMAIFAEPLVRLALGKEFLDAVPLVRILALAAAIALIGGTLGILLVARGVVYAQLTQNSIAIAVNVGGLFLLVPTFGVTAAAWLTVAAEAIVTLGSLFLLRRFVAFGDWLAVTVRPAGAILLATIAAFVLYGHLEIALPVSIIVFAAALVALKAWPQDLLPRRRGRGVHA